jgi:hypothetical protein
MIISPEGFELCFGGEIVRVYALHTWYKMPSRTSVSPIQTSRISSSRLCRATGTSFSMFRSRSKKLVSAAPNEYSGEQKNDHSESESNAQRRNALLFNHRNERGHLVGN